LQILSYPQANLVNRGAVLEASNGVVSQNNAAAAVSYPAFPLFFTLSPLLLDSARKAAPRTEKSQVDGEAESILILFLFCFNFLILFCFVCNFVFVFNCSFLFLFVVFVCVSS
jgi:hypothetical protein